MSNPKLTTDRIAVEHSNFNYGYSYRGTVHVPALKNRKITDLTVVDNYHSTGVDEQSNSYGGTAHHDLPCNHPLDHVDPSPVPNCVLKLNRRPKGDLDQLKESLLKRLNRRRIITLVVEESTVAICGYVNPATIAWTVSYYAGVGATLVFFKEHQGIQGPDDCENIVFRIYGDYSNRVKEELQKTKGINSVIVDSSDNRLWMSISGDCFDAGVIRDKIRKLCDCASKKDVKELSKKRAHKHLNAANDMTYIFEGNGALVTVDDPIVSNVLPNKHRANEAQITVDFTVPRYYQHECAAEINKLLLSTEGVRFVITHFRATRLASVKICGDYRLELDTILKTVSSAGGIKPRLRKSLRSAHFSFCLFCG